jgi:hypothetical protein
MMKRILLIVSLGVSFVAPAAFGNTDFSRAQDAYGNSRPGLKGYTNRALKTGEVPGWEAARLAEEGGSLCGLLTDLRAFEQESLEQGFTKNGGRPGASGAR